MHAAIKQLLSMVGKPIRVGGAMIERPLVTHQGRIVPMERFLKDCYPQMLWDTQTVTEGSTGTIQFFQQTTGGVRSVADVANGVIKAPSSFIVTRVAVQFFQTQNANFAINPLEGDHSRTARPALLMKIQDIISKAHLRWRLDSSKEVFDVPIHQLGGGAGITGPSAITGDGPVAAIPTVHAAVTLGNPDANSGYYLGVPVFIPSNTAVNVDLILEAALTWGANAVADEDTLDVRVVLDGLLSRAKF